MADNQETANKTANEQPKRNSLVDAAVIFLLNPEVHSKPNEKKVAFLKSKGLSDTEIALAFEKAERYPPDYPHKTAQRLSPYKPPPPLPPVQTYSFWSRFNRISTTVLILGIALFGLHRFYQLYIEPWLFGKESEADRLIRMEKQLTDVNSSVAQLKKTLSTLEETINNQKGKIDKFVQSEVDEYCLPTPLALRDLKQEISVIKSILLSRHQFPAVPKFSTSIPAWQLPDSEKNAEEDPESEKKVKEEAELQESAADDMDDVSIINGSLSSEHYTDVLDSAESVKQQ